MTTEISGIPHLDVDEYLYSDEIQENGNTEKDIDFNEADKNAEEEIDYYYTEENGV